MIYLALERLYPDEAALARQRRKRLIYGGLAALFPFLFWGLVHLLTH